MIIKLSATSNLLEKNNNWRQLESFGNLKFLRYGDVFSFQNSEKGKNIIDINLLFFDDIIESNSFKNYQLNQKKLLHLIQKLKKKIKKNKSPLIVGLSDYSYLNIIETAQNFEKKQLKYFFLQELYHLTTKFKNLYILDIDELFSVQGLEKCFDSRNYLLSRCRISTYGIEILSNNLKIVINRIQKSSKKVLLLDCDNTLWGGVIAEDGISKIKIGSEGEGLAFYQFQKAIKKIKDQGVLIALVSKNIREDVIKALDNHDSMIINSKDICSFKVNWREKATNIEELSQDLNLNLDSFVFWDDNPIEREKVKIKLKNVEVINPHQDISNWAKQLLEYEGFSKFKINSNDLSRTNQYKSRQKFIDSKASFKNETEYLKSIKIKSKILNLKEGNLDRAVQMCQRTNQFNLSSKRYNHEEIINLNKKHKCFLVHLRDIYGDHGIVSYVCAKKFNKNILLIDTFTLSCRVLGRYLENWILNHIKEIAHKHKTKYIIAEFISNEKNEVAKNFLLNNNFKKAAKNLINSNNLSNEKNVEIFMFDIKTKIKNLNIYENN